MNYWLIKSEPDSFSWEKFCEEKIAVWDGVRNYAARNHLRAMEVGDEVLFYHSNEGKEVVGIAKVSKSAYPDKTALEGDWSVVEVKPWMKLQNSVTLSQIKADAFFKEMALVKLSRLSVSPVSPEEYSRIVALGKPVPV